MSVSEGRRGRRVLLPLLLALVAPALLSAQAPRPEPDPPLAALAGLVLGSWEAPGSRHVHEWGVGRRLIRSRSYLRAGEEWTLVSEGMWWWDENGGTLRGIHFTVGMPMDRMEYATRVEGGRVIHDLRTFGAEEGRFREVWEFEGDGYSWSLEEPSGDGFRRIMGGEYSRAGGGEGLR